MAPAQGVYVLTDNSFKPFSRMSMQSPSEAVAKAQPVRRGGVDGEPSQLLLTLLLVSVVSVWCLKGRAG